MSFEPMTWLGILLLNMAVLGPEVNVIVCFFCVLSASPARNLSDKGAREAQQDPKMEKDSVTAKLENNIDNSRVSAPVSYEVIGKDAVENVPKVFCNHMCKE